MAIVPEPQWRELAREINGRTALLMGRSDTGKTTLARYVLGELLPDPGGVCFVDADVGQSSLGLPGTVCMRTFHQSQEVSGARYDLMRFVGAVSPASRIPEIISMTARMVERARASGASAVMVDTTGLVDGEAGKELKLGKIRAVKPDIVIAIEREDELGHILPLVRGPHVYRMKAAGPARRRTRAARIQYRHARLKKYFRDSRAVEFPLGVVRAERRGRHVDIRSFPPPPGTVVGLATEHKTLALGLFEGLSGDVVLIRTPLVPPAPVSIIEVGDFAFEGGR